MREDGKEFLNEWRPAQAIGKYSDHIGIPVSILTAVKDDEGKDNEEKHWEQH
ncbi:hypothetical protein OK016_04310 [Vibrio chagasii]|nr:hypothetical protein [Vibrio chagasii]